MKAIRLAGLVVVVGVILTSCPDFPIPIFYGNLLVDIQPIDAVDEGAQWQLDGGAWQNSDTTVSRVSIGTHTIAFKDVYGWTTPVGESIDILHGKTITAKAYYVENGIQGIVAHIQPAGAILLGALWRVDGGGWQEDGATVQDLAVGNHVVSFNQVDGATAPPDQQVTVNAWELSAVTGIYDMPNGLVTTTIEPVAAVTNGAQWQLDNGEWQNASTTVSGVTPGNHVVSFNAIPGYTAPAGLTVSVEAGQNTTADGVYVVATGGSLEATITPQAAIDAGAQWQIVGSAFNNSGATVTNLVAGIYTVSFSAISGWTKPADASVTITAGQATQVTGPYAEIPVGSLEVTITPQAAIDAGAQWQVDGGAFNNSGATVTQLATGSHTVSFTAVSGWTPPADATVTVTANQTTQSTGTYMPIVYGSLLVVISPQAAIDAGAQWQLDGGDFNNSGVTLSGLEAGSHTVSFKPLTDWTIPANVSVTIAGNKTATATGTYTAATSK